MDAAAAQQNEYLYYTLCPLQNYPLPDYVLDFPRTGQETDAAATVLYIATTQSIASIHAQSYVLMY